MAKLKGRDARAANAFLRSVVIWYDSRWLLEREGDEGRAADFHFRQPFAKGQMSNEEYQAYRGMFIKEALKLNARWLIVCNVHFHDGKQEYIESGEIVTDQCKINARDADFIFTWAGHVARPWRITVTVHADYGDCMDEFTSEPISVELKYQYVEQLVDTIISQIKDGINPKYIRHSQWTAEVWHHKADGTPTRNKRKTKRRKGR